MKYSKEEVIQYVLEDDVKFIRLAFCDVFGKQKNIAITKNEIVRAFEQGIAIDGSSIDGFADVTHSDILLFPDPITFSDLPWRPEHGKVVRMFSSIKYTDGTPFVCDTRQILKNAIKDAARAGLSFYFGSEQEFYLFKLDEKGNPTKEPYDMASCMDIAPEDKGENVRREICITLEQMGIYPESSHHEVGPGQNEIDFRYSDPLTAADNALTFQTVVRTIAKRNGLFADFSPKPLSDQPGNGFHINFSITTSDNSEFMQHVIAGILAKGPDMTLFMNPTDNSYTRFGKDKAPKYITWSRENRSPFVRVTSAEGSFRKAELRSPDPSANPYLAFALMIYAGLYGVKNKLPLPETAKFSEYKSDRDLAERFQPLPGNLRKAGEAALGSDFINTYIPAEILRIYGSGKVLTH
ncbi:MAG: glutamine synthetase [Eubacterium sp.]|nr:glutamine synthetase [Eubacterium sp.]